MSVSFISMALLISLCSLAQPKTQGFDHNFRPTSYSPYYYVVTEKKDNKWYREAYFIATESQAMQGWYLDEACKIADGETKWFHRNKMIRYVGNYKNGKREGLWLYFHDNGQLRDSASYVNGSKKGISRGWDEKGILTDSTSFDGNGNGTEYYFHDNGQLKHVGQWLQDSLQHGTWSYYFKDGKLQAKEEYVNGKLTSFQCFDENGKPRSSADCEGREASFAGGDKQWKKFLQNNLKPTTPVDNGAPVGIFTVLIQFVVNEDGSLSDFQTLTNHGYGMEKEVERLMHVSPRWTNARMYGLPVKAYRIQPVTFQVVDE